MDAFAQELRHAARRLRRSPAFTIATVLTLALAIGANGAIFAVVERVVLNPLPYPDSDRLVELDTGASKLRVSSGMGIPSGLYFHYVNRSRVIESAAIFTSADQTITSGAEPERVRVTTATPSLASVLQVPPMLGRWFTDEEGRRGSPAAAILSNGLWTRRFGGNAAVIGQSIVLGGRPATIVGVMPASFAFPDPRTELWTVSQVSAADGFGLFDHSGVARLRPGVSFAMARAELQGLIADVPAAYPDDPRAEGNVSVGLSFTGRPLKDATLGNITRGLWILLASVGVVLLVACANIANLLLVRSDVHRREVAIRRAIGAERASLLRYFLSESLLLSAIGGGIGLLIAWSALRLLVRLGPARLPRLHEIHLDAVTVAWIGAIGAVAAIAFALIPLWRGAALADVVHEGRANTATRRRHRARHVLLGAQVAFALTLLVASGLMVRSFQHLRAVDPGFDPSSAVTFSIGLPDREYPTIDAAVAAHHALIDRLSALPGVTAVSGTTCLPLSGGCSGNSVKVEGRAITPNSPPTVALFRAVAAGYFETAGTRVLRGRPIDRDDVDRKQPVAVISRTLAARAFPDEDPIGRRMASNQPPPRPGLEPTLTWLTVVGIVADTPAITLTDPPPPMLYMPLSLARGADVPVTRQITPSASPFSFVVRTTAPPLDLVPAIRETVRSFDGTLAMAQVASLQQILDRASAQMAFTMVLLAIAATVALLLGVVGIYGVMSYIVSQRTTEIGVRLALGAEPGRIANQILRQGALVAIAGIAVGIGVALAGGGLIGAVLYGVSPRDPAVYATMAAGLLCVALLACWLPARRAARLNPVAALRAE